MNNLVKLAAVFYLGWYVGKKAKPGEDVFQATLAQAQQTIQLAEQEGLI